MSKHTSGPWRWWACKETKKPSEDYIQIAAGLKHVAQVRIASITEHDMRLISAAPDLLETLKKLRAMCADFGAHTACEIASAAIEKATGEQT
jgi:hypothetical protein